MSHFRLLDRARAHLERGDLLGAESDLDAARDAWGRSRFRTPIVERRVEPVLRRVAGWFGRESDEPVLRVFDRQASLLEDDLRALADLLHGEARSVLDRDVEGLVESDRETLEHALRLDGASRVYALERAERWAALRGYLHASRRLARPVDDRLLPSEIAGPDQEAWLGDWAEAVLSGSGVTSEELVRWLERQAIGLARLEGAASARWAWIAAQGALRDPDGGERALDAVEFALDAGLETERPAALRSLAGLMSNEHVLAVPGADVRERLDAWSDRASGADWPPADIEALLEARRVEPGSAAIVVAAWSASSSELVLVLHRGTEAVDALVLRPVVTDDAPRSRFEASLPEARGWIQRWVPEDAVVLVDGAPKDGIRDLLAPWTLLDVRGLTERIPAPFVDVESPLPAVAHPLWSAPGGHDVFRPLADRARSLVPRLSGWLDHCPAFTTAWGRDALDALAAHGLDTCGALAQAVDRLVAPPAPIGEELQSVALSVPLRWPRLEARPWPSEATPVRPRVVDRSRAGTIWLDHAANVDELVDVAVSGERSEILTTTASRARTLADRSAGRTDPRRVSTTPRIAACPEPWLARLDGWLREAIGDRDRQLDVLWLWRLLAETANGDLEATGDDPRTRDLVDATGAEASCTDACRLTRDGACWSAQRAGRVEVCQVYVVPIATRDDSFPAPTDVLADDPRAWIADVHDDAARATLDHGIERARAAERAWVWTPAGALAPALRAQWNARVEGPLHVASADVPASPLVAMCPPGYRPGDPFLAAESELLTRLRREFFDGTDVAWWDTLGSRTDPPTARHGAGVDAIDPIVVTARLGAPGRVDPLLLLLRAASAQGHAARAWVCLDPRLAFQLEFAGGRFGDAGDADLGALDDVVDRALENGRHLVDAAGSRTGVAWDAPLTEERLVRLAGEHAAAVDAAALARGLRTWGRGRQVWIGGATDLERALVIDLIRALAERSVDGGPLGVRCVVAITAAEGDPEDARATRLGPDDADRLGAVMLEAERGRLSRVDLHPDLLREESLAAWARRVASVAWVLPDAEAIVGRDRGSRSRVRTLRVWREALERSGAVSLAFVDAVSEGPRSRITRWAGNFDARAFTLPSARTRYGGWRVDVEDLLLTELACWNCGEALAPTSAAAACPACANLALDRPGPQRRARRAAIDALAAVLGGGSDDGWWAIASDPALVERVRHRLGIDDYESDRTPLLAGASGLHDVHAVLHADDLATRRGRPPEQIFWIGVPRSRADLETTLLRLNAMRAPRRHVRVLLPPPGIPLVESASLRGRWRWKATRTEVEFRLRGHAATDLPAHRPLGLRPDPELGIDVETPLRRREALFGDVGGHGGTDVATLLDAIVSAGPRFDTGRWSFLHETALPPEVDADAVGSVLEWAHGLDLVEREGAVGDDEAESGFERTLRAVDRAAGATVETLGLVDTHPDVEPERGIEEVVAPTGTQVVTAEPVAGRTARDAVGTGGRRLVVVPGEGARIAWSDVDRNDVEVVSFDEFALALLVAHWRENGGRSTLRLMPETDGARSEETRLRLMRETSRRYARRAGAVPPIDAPDLRRVIHGEPLSIAPAQARGLDVALLERSAAEARSEFGWMTREELRVASRRVVRDAEDLVERWRRRYARVVFDATHELGDDVLEFARALVPEAARFEVAESLLLPADREGVAARADADLPPEWTKAIVHLSRAAGGDVPRLRATRGRGGGRIDRTRVLTLGAAIEWIADEVAPDRTADRTAVVVAHADDRTDLTVGLQRHGLSVVSARTVGEWAASGPRHALAALHLVAGDARADLIDLLAGSADDAAERFRRWTEAATGRGVDRLAADEVRWAPLARLRGRIDGEETVRSAVERVVATGALDAVLARDASGGRLEAWIGAHGDRAVDDALARLEPGLVANPLATTGSVFVLGPADLLGPSYEHVVVIGTGREPASRFVRAFLRAERRVSVLFSEIDPLA